MEKKSHKGKLWLLILIILGVGRFGRILYRQNQIQERREQAEFVSKTADVREDIVSSQAEDMQENGKKLQNILQSAGHAEAKEKFTTYVEIDDSYGLGERDGRYVIFETFDGKETELTGVDLAYVLPVKNQDEGTEFQAIFARKDGVWAALDEKGENVIALDGLEVTETSSFFIKDRTLHVE